METGLEYTVKVILKPEQPPKIKQISHSIYAILGEYSMSRNLNILITLVVRKL